MPAVEKLTDEFTMNPEEETIPELTYDYESVQTGIDSVLDLEKNESERHNPFDILKATPGLSQLVESEARLQSQLLGSAGPELNR